MKARHWLALGALTLAACGGRQNLLLPPDGTDAGTATAVVGPVDLTQAPTTLVMSCDHGVGVVAFDNPCLVGHNLAGASSSGFDASEVECTLSTPSHPVTWAFVLPLSQIAANPSTPLSFPSDFSSVPSAGGPVGVGGQTASVSGVSGTVTFSRVDPANRAFVARLKGTFTWTTSAGSTFQCAVDAPFWGAPGGFT